MFILYTQHFFIDFLFSCYTIISMNKENDNIVAEAFSRFERINQKFRKVEKLHKDLGTGELIYVGEVHTLVAVKAYPGINLTELSSKLGVTKGALSQTIGKLEKRGCVNRVKDKNNEKNVLVELTKKGTRIIKAHDEFHKDFFSKYLKDITFGQVAVFNEVLEKIESFMDSKLDNEK